MEDGRGRMSLWENIKSDHLAEAQPRRQHTYLFRFTMQPHRKIREPDSNIQPRDQPPLNSSHNGI